MYLLGLFSLFFYLRLPIIRPFEIKYGSTRVLYDVVQVSYRSAYVTACIVVVSCVAPSYRLSCCSPGTFHDVRRPAGIQNTIRDCELYEHSVSPSGDVRCYQVESFFLFRLSKHCMLKHISPSLCVLVTGGNRELLLRGRVESAKSCCPLRPYTRRFTTPLSCTSTVCCFRSMRPEDDFRGGNAVKVEA